MRPDNNDSYSAEKYFDSIYGRSEDSIEVCDDCELPIEECECHKHDKYDEDRDRENEGHF